MMKRSFTKLISCALSVALAMSSLIVPQVNVGAEAISEVAPDTVAIAEYSESEVILTTTSCPDDLTRTTTTTTNAVTEITTTTAPQESFKKLISFVDSESGEYIGCIDAKVLLVGRVFNEETQHWEYTDEFEIVDEWNTTDSNPHQMNDLKITDNSLGYRIIVEKLPEDYYYGGSNWTYVRTNITQTDGNMEIAIKHVEPDEYTYPLSGTWVADVKVVNVKTGEYISGVKCKAVDLENNEIVDTWTSDNDTHRIDNLRFTFESQVSYDSENSYGIWVSDIPEGYRLYAGLTDEGESDANHILINYPMFEFQKNEFELVCPVRLENINDPVETTSTVTQTSTVTTTTTTAAYTRTTPYASVSMKEQPNPTIAAGETKDLGFSCSLAKDVVFSCDSPYITVYGQTDTSSSWQGTVTIKCDADAPEGDVVLKVKFGHSIIPTEVTEREFKLTITPQTEPKFEVGDANRDGLLDGADASLILFTNADYSDKILENGEIDYDYLIKAYFDLFDVNKDGMIDGVDASLVLVRNAEMAGETD